MTKLILYFLTGIVILPFFKFYYNIVIINFGSPQSSGEFGDMFGALNALFSGLALIGVIVAIYLQGKELSSQREELKLTRQELSKTAIAQTESAKYLAKQAESMKVTAKLNGLDALLQYEISKLNNKNVRNNAYVASVIGRISAYDSPSSSIENILREIRSVVDSE